MLLSGITCEPSAMHLSAISWAASLADPKPSSAESPASPTPSPATSLATMIREIYGPRRIASLSSMNRYSLCSLRMFQGCLQLAERDVSSKTWKDWVSRLRQASLRRRKSGQATSGNDCSSWPTADCNTSTYSNGERGMNLREAGQTWPTPNASPDAPNASTTRENGREARRLTDQCLASVAKKFWHMPNVPNRGPETADSKANRPGAGGIDLQTEVQLWPTPAGRDHRSQNSTDSQVRRNLGSKRGQQLPNFVSQCFHPGQPASKHGEKSSKSTRRLNPRFVEWLMGWPRNWTQCTIARDDSDYLETVFTPWKQRMRSCLLRLCSTNNHRTITKRN